MNNRPEPAFFTLTELADYLRISRKKAFDMTTAGELPGFRCGDWRYRIKDIDDWIAARMNTRKSEKQ